MPKYYCYPTTSEFMYETCVVYDAEPTDVHDNYRDSSDELIEITFEKELGSSVFASFEEWKVDRDESIKKEITELEQRLLYLESVLVTPPKTRERKVYND